MTDEQILDLAKKRFARCVEAQDATRTRARDDIKFAAASPDDPWQWSEQDRQSRKNNQRPCLTINKMPQHIRQVTNDIRQNRPAIRFRPADDKADPEVASILMGLVKHIEANSDADVAYDTASEHQVTHGEGFIRVMNDYARPESFDQDIFIKRVKDPFRVYLDPDIQDPAGADAVFGFVEERLTEDEFRSQYPGQDPIDWDFANDAQGWYTSGDKSVRVCEYFYIEEKADTLCLYSDGSTGWKSDKKQHSLPKLKERKGKRKTVQWAKLTGLKVMEKQRFPGQYVPIARVVGNEFVVEDKVITSGIVRNAKDSQRMYNVAQSAIVERVMQAPKTPWTAAAAAVEGYESIWQTANTASHNFLPWNHKDDEGLPIPQPVRVQPATVETGLQQIAMGASDDIKSETGQYDASLGQKSNETSGKAILARQREGDTSTYHYVDNLGRAVRLVGRIILSMMPEVYDTARVARIIGEDDKEVNNAYLQPELPVAMQQVRGDDGAMKRLFNPFVGQYDVYATTGPSFTTRRVEAAQAMTDLTQANPALWGVIGDQLVKNMDWPGAEDMAERLKLTLIPPVQEMLNKDEGAAPVDPAVQQELQQGKDAIAELSHALEAAHQEHEALEMEIKNKAGIESEKLAAEAERVRFEAAEKKEIERMKIESDERIKAAELELKREELKLKEAEIGARLQRERESEAVQHSREDQAVAKQDTEKQAKTDNDAGMTKALTALGDTNKQIAAALTKLSKPRKLITNEKGDPIGSAHED
jgi:hypothetical protein